MENKKDYTEKDISFYTEKQEAIKLWLMEDENKTEKEVIDDYGDQIEGFDDDYFEIGSVELRVLTEGEMEQAWDEQLDSYIDDCLDIPDHLSCYFDDEKWKADARMDGAGHTLAHYDGMEYEYGGIYIYRTN